MINFFSFSQVSLNNIGDTYSQNFNSLVNSGTAAWTDNSTLSGWYSNKVTYTANDGASGTGNFYSYGTTSSSERALGSLASGGSTYYYGVRIINNSCSPFTSFSISYVGEQWRNAANASANKLDFQYQLNATDLTSGTWTDENTLDFTGPQVSGTPNALDGNAVANKVVISGTLTITVLPGDEIWIRWKDIDDAGTDHGLSIDNFDITSNGTAGQTYWYFRSATSGNWNNKSSWEASCDNSTWVAAAETPTNLAKTISVRTGHTITVTASVTFDQVIADGTLIYGNNAGSTITINDGTGIDLTVNGTFEDNGPNNISWSGASTWSLGSAATIIRTRSTSAAGWQNNYDGGISTIPSTAFWIVRKNSTDNPTMTGVGMYYPNLTIENNYTSAWTTGVGTSFSGTTDIPRILGNFDIGGTGTNIVSFANNNTNASSTLVQGTLTVQNGSTLRNYGTGFELQGNLVVDGTVIYDADDGRKIIFSGANAQSISGSGTLNVYYLQVNKTAGNVTLNRAVTVDNSLVLTNKNIISSTKDMLTLIAGSTCTGASDNSFVDGPCRKIGNTDFTFPVGKDAKYRLIAATGISASESFTAEYFHQNPNLVPYDITLKDATLDHISQCEYWILDRAGTESAFVTLSWDSYSCGVDSLSALKVARWDGGMWKDHGNGGTTGSPDPGTGTIITSGAVTSFSPFTLASNIPLPNNPLPIEIINFRVKYNGKTVDLYWETMSEKNKDFFLVEKSSDGNNFHPIGKVDASMNSFVEKKYFLNDASANENINYYRLKLMDLNGKFSYSNIIMLRISDLSFEISPNPFSDHVYILSNDKAASIIIFDVIGKIILQKNISSTETLDLSFLPNGVYFLKAVNGENMVVKKIVKE